MYRISKTFEFSAAHHLPYLPVHHKCRRPHGHNYTVTVVLECEVLDPDGFVTDYGKLEDVKLYIAAELDHRDLNDKLERPTAEFVAELIYNMAAPAHPLLSEVTVCETPKTSATYRP